MRQTLFFIPAKLFGLDVFGFGLGLAVFVFAVLACAVWRLLIVKRLDESVWSYFGLLLVGGGIIAFIAPNVLEPEGFPIRGYGACLLAAIVCALALVLHLTRRKGISPESVINLCLWAVVCGILGARVFYITEYWPEMAVRDMSGGLQLVPTLYNAVNIANGGLVVFGSILGGALGSLVYMIRAGLPILSTFDAMAPAMMLGLAIGRIGCFLNGCCFGGPSDVPWAVVFPEGSPAHLHQIEHGETFFDGLKFTAVPDAARPLVRIDAVQPGSAAEKAGLAPDMILRGLGGLIGNRPLSMEPASPMDVIRWIDAFRHENGGANIRFDVYTDAARTETKSYFVGPSPACVLPVHPTQLYSSVGGAALCVVLLLLGHCEFFRRRDGLVFAAFLLLYPAMRFCLEMIRTDEDSFLGTGLTVSQNVSIAVFLAGLILFIYLLSPKRRAA